MTEKLNKYYNTLCEAYDRNEWFFAQNEDRAHNAVIMLVMLEKSNYIKMFCGEMSVFRNSFYDEIEKEHLGQGVELKRRMADALRRFLNREDSTLKIVMEFFDKAFFSDTIVPKTFFVSNSNVELSALPKELAGKLNIPHLAFTEDERMVRIELDKDTHEAICKIGIVENAASPASAFNRIYTISRPVTA